MAPRGADRRVQERTLVTRAALLDAAIERLVDWECAATTTIETVRLGGVSRREPDTELAATVIAVERCFTAETRTMFTT
jgi:hypothetical protein